MENKHKEILDSNRVYLVKNLEIGSLFLSYLIKDKVMYTQNEEEIEAKTTTMKKAGEFINILKRKGPTAFVSFIKALIHTHQTFVAEKLDNELTLKLKETIEKEDSQENIGDGDPEAPTKTTLGKLVTIPCDLSEPKYIYYDSRKTDEVIKNKIKDLVMSKEFFFKFDINYNIERPNEEDDCYPCHREMRGVVYLLNLRFEGMKGERKGSEVDEQNIKDLFEKMGYLVEVIKENKIEDIQKKVEAIKSNEILWKMGMFVMFLMSYGDKDVRGNSYLEDIDGKKMIISHVFVKPFTEKCPALNTKPKLFFVQSCRGDPDEIYFDNCNMEKPTLETLEHQPYTHPATDVFKFFSSPEDYKSIRSPRGSLLLRCLVLTIAHFCHQKPLEFMVMCVNSIMESIIVENQEKKELKQMSISQSSMTKDVFFNPLNIIIN